MWQVKTFKTEKSMMKLIKDNEHRLQCEIIFINNGYGVEYRKLRRIA